MPLYIERHNVKGLHPLDVARVGDPPDLPLGSDDPTILAWAGREGRIVISRDERTLPGHLAAHVASGLRSPGIFLTREVPYPEIVEFMVCCSYASEPSEWAGQVTFIR